MDKKILIVVNNLDFFLSHRNTLAQELIKNGFSVIVITDMVGTNYHDKNIKFIDFAIDRASINPLSFFLKVIKLRKYISIYPSDIFYFVSHKSNILGGLASFFQPNKVTIFSITGLGYAFINNNLVARILKLLILWIYSIFAKKANALFVFQNNDDRRLFLDHRVLNEKQATIIPGMGVDLKKFLFQQREIIDHNPVKVLFAGRLLIDKGIQEFITLASRLKNKNFEFYRYRLSSTDFIYNSNSLVLNFLIQARGLGFKVNEGKMLNLLEKILNGLNEEGFWYYNYSTKRIQLDYHQGFIIDMLVDAYNHSFGDRNRLFNAIKKSTSFYKNKQFNSKGVSIYRLPNKWPVDIHNQAQGIITFSKVSSILPEYAEFSSKILNWTEDNMFDNDGFFYYQMWPFFTNKIQYMRWSQAWMHLALSQDFCTEIA